MKPVTNPINSTTLIMLGSHLNAVATCNCEGNIMTACYDIYVLMNNLLYRDALLKRLFHMSQNNWL